jgi:hypothetical protein
MHHRDAGPNARKKLMLQTHMDSMRVDMVNGFAEARENSVSGGGSPFSYTCSQWTSVDGGRRGAKVEHR